MGITQESFHFIKKKKRCALVLKLDLVKAFDRVNWTYLRLILLQIGISLMGVNWIMGCISSTNFALLVNGSPSGFFTASRGIRQGCPLSPLLFILVIEGLSLLIADARDNGLIKGIKITSTFVLTHLLFVDDVILLGSGTLTEWMAFEVILSRLCRASGMCINVDKSSFLYNNVAVDICTDIAKVLTYKMETISVGFMYLGYFLKPLGYRVCDWHWLIQRFERWISHWVHKFLSIGGRLTLVQALLTSIPIY